MPRSGAFLSRILSTLLSVLLVSCGSSSDHTGHTGPQSDGSPQDTAGCTERIDSGDLTIPVTLTNSASECDYYITGFLRITSPITIEAGTTIVMGQGASISLSEGQLIAVGTSQERITIRGESPLQGFWGGIRMSNMRPSRIEYVDIMDGGDNSGGPRSTRGGLYITSSTVSLIGMSVSNSQNYGLNLGQTTRLTEFSANRFHGNLLEGLQAPVNLIPQLDVATDYHGTDVPNERPFINVIAYLDEVGIANWKALNAPYGIGYLAISDDEHLTLGPGVHLVIDDDTSLSESINVINGARLTIAGSAEAPVVIGPLPFANGPWTTLKVAGGFITVDHASITGATSAITVVGNTSRLSVTSSTLSGHSEWAIYCDTNFGEPINEEVLQLGSNVRFSGNGLGNLSPDCPGQ